MSDDCRLEARVQRLERTHRLLVGVAIVAVLGAWGGSPSEPEILSATAFHLVDNEGKVVARFSTGDDGPGLFILDREGRDRLRLIHEAEQTGMFVVDAEGHTRIGVAQFAHGGGGFALHGPKAKGAAVLYLKGNGALSFYDADGNVQYRVPNE